MRWGHLTWPGDLTLRDLSLKFSQHVRKRCMIRCVKNGAAARRRFWTIWKKPEGGSQQPPPAGRRLSGKLSKSWKIGNILPLMTSGALTFDLRSKWLKYFLNVLSQSFERRLRRVSTWVQRRVRGGGRKNAPPSTRREILTTSTVRGKQTLAI